MQSAEPTDEAIVTYDCPLGGQHAPPGDEVRIMFWDGGEFVVACVCGGEPLTEANSQPHPTRDHLVMIGANDPTPAEWLRLDAAADGWYALNPHTPREHGTGTYAQQRQQIRERARELADEAEPEPIDGNHDERDEAARGVVCPKCNANSGRKCQRPSGHRVRSSHSARIEAAVDDGVLTPQQEEADDTADATPGEQVALTGWSA
ncbi:zinc finger domain-containing protein [Halostella litorea]|uniref:zinc finger domain-containing protein n=1 Tax=Halostella litorea TaxID=2528831 RepID=UPI00192A5593|nr:hypothetical protein [Halostella litorea]